MTIQIIQTNNTWQSYNISNDSALWTDKLQNVFFSTGSLDPNSTGVNGTLLAGLQSKIFIKSGSTIWLKSKEDSFVLIDDQIINTSSSSTPVIPSDVTVIQVRSFDGNDSTGNGSVLQPYKTISYALSQIIDASSVKPYLINAFGVFSDSDWLLKPNIYYDFNGAPYSVINQFSLDSGWNLTDGKVYINNVNLTLQNGASLDFNGINCNSASIYLNFVNIQTNSQFDVTGHLNNPCNFYLNNSIINGSLATIRNCNNTFFNTTIEQFQMIHSSSFQGTNQFYYACSFPVSPTFNESTGSGLFLVVQASYFIDAIFYGSGPGTLIVYSRGNTWLGNVLCFGPSMLFNSDVKPSSLILVSGAISDILTLTRASNLSDIPDRQASGDNLNFPRSPIIGINANTVLPSPLHNYYICFPSTDIIVTLPGGNDVSPCIRKGYPFIIENSDLGYRVILHDDLGALIGIIPSGYYATVYLDENLTQEGSWFFVLTKNSRYTQTIQVNTSPFQMFFSPYFAYVANSSSLITFILPPILQFGSIIRVIGLGSGGWRINQNASQSIKYDNVSTTPGVGGYLESGTQFSDVELFCADANTIFNITAPSGNLNLV